MTPPYYEDVVNYGWQYTAKHLPSNHKPNPHEGEYERIRKAFENNLYKWHEGTNEMLFQGWHNVHCSPAEMLRRLGEVWGETEVEVIT